MGKRPIICANISYLRKLFGESPEDLGEILDCERSAIYNYEKFRIPKYETVIKIAKHYTISVEELLSVDLTDTNNLKLKYDPEAFFKSVYELLPVFPQNQPSKDFRFNNSYNYQRELFDSFNSVKLNNKSSMDIALDKLFSGGFQESLSSYSKCEDASVKAFAAANYLSLFFLLWLLINSVEKLKDRPAFLQILEEQSLINKREIDDMIEHIDDDFFDICVELRNNYYDEINNVILTLKNEVHWGHLADYYIALRYILGFVNNGLDSAYNNRIGVELMNTYALLGNARANQYLKFIIKSQYGNPQNVDDN